MTTIYLPLEESLPFPATPGFLAPSSEPSEHVRKVIKNILKARRIAVVCGAGISVQAGIPDFRSSEGLFQTLKKDNPTLSSGKDLFDASVFNSESTTSLFCQMIAQLSELSKSASPTAFHQLLRALDDRGRLLRVYTQNIDALESRAGLTFGVPEADGGRRFKPRSSKGNTNSPSSHITSETLNGDAYTQSEPIASTSRLPSPPVETPRCIPLHGTLQHMYCQVCQRSFPLSDYLDSLTLGSPPYCPECTEIEATRQLVGKRSRGVGKLRPSVVLYNEAHRDGEEVGEVVRRDLCGGRSKGVGKGKGKAGGADLLLVVGTSLRVPGTKRIVREFSKAVRSRASSQESNTSASTSGDVGLATPVPSPRRTPSVDDDPPVRVIYLNLDFPVPTREWEGVFDVWIRGDAQQFAELVHEEMRAEERLREEKEEKRKRREEE
ncbi:DHS-like NAD/FAD-binding domain-containing protein, partial [Panus rudis PR-1116 ss-1]